MSWRIRVVTARHYAEISLRHNTIDNPGSSAHASYLCPDSQEFQSNRCLLNFRINPLELCNSASVLPCESPFEVWTPNHSPHACSVTFLPLSPLPHRFSHSPGREQQPPPSDFSPHMGPNPTSWMAEWVGHFLRFLVMPNSRPSHLLLRIQSPLPLPERQPKPSHSPWIFRASATYVLLLLGRASLLPYTSFLDLPPKPQIDVRVTNTWSGIGRTLPYLKQKAANPNLNN